MTGFTYFESYHKAIRNLPDDMRLKLYDVIFDYMFDEKEPELDVTEMAFFELMRPHLDTSKKRGKAGGTKDSSNKKQKKSKRNQNKSNEIKVKLSSSDEVEVEGEVEKEIEEELRSDVCATRSSDHVTPQAVIMLPLVDGTEYGVPQADVDEYIELYPAVDVMQELRNMRGWCLDNPRNRKTRTGVKRFIGGWLQAEQNRGRARPPSKRNPFNDGQRQVYDMAALKQQCVANG